MLDVYDDDDDDDGDMNVELSPFTPRSYMLKQKYHESITCTR